MDRFEFGKSGLKQFLLRVGFWCPIIISLLLVASGASLFLKADIIENIISALLVIFICNLVGKNKLGLSLELMGLVAFNFFLYLEIAHIYLFNDSLSASSIYLSFEVNDQEISEFVAMYFDFTLILIGVIQLLFVIIHSVWLIKNYRKEGGAYVYNFRLRLGKRRLHLSFVLLFLLLFSVVFSNKILRYYMPYAITSAYIQYRNDLVTYDKNFGNYDAFTEVTHETNADEQEVYVVIVGESTTRHHMGLYGYYRQTNPKLSKLDNLYVFNDVISPHTHTMASLDKILTMESFESPDDKFDGSVVQLFNQAGFVTYWLSNQQPIGYYATSVTGISQNCKKRYFMNVRDSNGVSYDKKVLAPLQKILNQKGNKKIIFVHLMGTHGAYFMRYPKEFETYTSTPKTKFKHQLAYDRINEYDNAILYNDHIVHSIIELVKAQNVKSSVIYFSDHGEEVFETVNNSFHSESVGSKPMFDIPFMVWFSEKYNLHNSSLQLDLNRKYNLEDFVFTLSDIASIDFEGNLPSRSIVNSSFEPKKRMILKGKVYDERFQGEP